MKKINKNTIKTQLKRPICNLSSFQASNKICGGKVRAKEAWGMKVGRKSEWVQQVNDWTSDWASERREATTTTTKKKAEWKGSEWVSEWVSVSERVEAALGGPTLPEPSSEADARIFQPLPQVGAPPPTPAEFTPENLPAAWPSCHGTARFVEAAHAEEKKRRCLPAEKQTERRPSTQ